jgi:hypothetical protein
VINLKLQNPPRAEEETKSEAWLAEARKQLDKK